MGYESNDMQRERRDAIPFAKRKHSAADGECLLPLPGQLNLTNFVRDRQMQYIPCLVSFRTSNWDINRLSDRRGGIEFPLRFLD